MRCTVLSKAALRLPLPNGDLHVLRRDNMMKRLFRVTAVGLLLFATGCWYLPHDPAEHGYKPLEEVVQKEGKFIMRRYKVKSPLLRRMSSGNSNRRAARDRYDTVIIVSDLKGRMLAHIGHVKTDLKIEVSPEGIWFEERFVWKSDLGQKKAKAAEQAESTVPSKAAPSASSDVR